MRNLLVLAGLTYLVGTVIGLGLGEASRAAPVWAAAAVLVGVAVALRRSPWRRWALLGGVFAVAVLVSVRETPVPSWLRRRAPEITEVIGTVASYPSLGVDRATFTFRPDVLPSNLRVTWFTEDEPLPPVGCGDRWKLVGSVRLPEAFDGFDYPAYLARQGIFATMTVEGAGGVRLDETAGSVVLRVGDGVRRRVIGRLRDALGAEAAALAQGLLLGDRTALSGDVEGSFRSTGLMHVLAVSGLHLGIVLAGIWFGLRRLGWRPLLTYPVVGLVVLLVLWIVGPRVSLLRASLLFAFLGLGSVLADLGWILRRSIDPLNGLATAAIVLLALAPGEVLDAGFQLSFAATAGILLAVSPNARQRWEPWVEGVAGRAGRFAPVARWTLTSVVVSAAAQAGVAPVVAWHFGTFHPLLVGLNLLVVPLVTLALAVGVPTVLLLGLGAPHFVAAPFGWVLHALSGAVRLGAHLPLVELPITRVAAVWVATLVVFTASAGLFSHPTDDLSDRLPEV